MKVSAFIDEFEKKGWQMPDLYERLYEFIDDPEQVFEFCQAFMFKFDESTTFFNDALSFLTSEDLQKIVDLTFARIDEISPSIVEEIVQHTALQHPDFLHPYLAVIWQKQINYQAYSFTYSWRNLPQKDILVFKEKLLSSTDKDKQETLIMCLLQTRHLPTLYFLKDFVADKKLRSDFIYYLEGVGFTLKGDEIVSYCPHTAYHFSFAKNYFLPQKPIFLNKDKHPTWRLPTDGKTYKMGGVIKDDEKNPLLHLFTLDSPLQGINIGMDKVVFGLHISELIENWETLFYQHDESGMPHRIGEMSSQIDFVEAPIMPCEVAFSPTPARWMYQDWGASNSSENLFRIGGEPTWVQSSEVPICPISGEKMTFLFQLDSDLPNIENIGLDFGSGGILYAFWCETSRVSAYFFQCT